MHSKKNVKCMQEAELIAIPVSVELSNHSSLPSLELLNRVVTTAVTKKILFANLPTFILQQNSNFFYLILRLIFVRKCY